MRSVFFTLSVLLYVSSNLMGQSDLTTPFESQAAAVSQTIGISKLDVAYHSPGVKGRTIWGSVVPYDRVWRAGANENTVFSCDKPVTIDGKKLESGSYGLHMIPGKDSWTIIFSRDYEAWGSYFYNPLNDAARVKVKPLEAPFTEWLNYSFSNKGEDFAVLTMQWEKVRIDIRIEVDVKSQVVENFKKELTSLAGFDPAAYVLAANYCIENNTHLELAETWLKQSLKMRPGFSSYLALSQLNEIKGNKEDAEKMMVLAIPMGTENELNTYGYLLIQKKQVVKAVEIFDLNCKNHPNSWNCFDSLAEAYGMLGDKKKAVKYYEKAKILAPENQKSRIEAAQKSLL